ncbi:hypothetical protein Acid345_2313 [Candidatus Koribacter versatilis Ellin345]|uniref:DUF4230 domain-containing protein n=2 Tax=Candidatus Korobacter versatilis TaxID=658062 RepID=Q1IP86_KORVE|nr:hypothetical protein Acid345_2313 [Candidatus Koribacter versatilis Ellin345]
MFTHTVRHCSVAARSMSSKMRPMTPVETERPATKVARSALAVVAGAVIATVLIGFALWAVAGIGLAELGKIARGGKIQINVDQPTVIQKIRALNRLESVSYTMDKIVTGERENLLLPHFLAGDRLLLVVHGEVIAGVDLSKLAANDVKVSGKIVHVHLPPAEIFTTRLDNAKTKVYSRDTGVFSTPDPNLEGEVREEAERQLTSAALRDGVLKTAQQNAAQTITSLLGGLGFEKVELQ